MATINSSIRDNYKRAAVGDVLINNIKTDSELSIVSTYFTIYAWQEFESVKTLDFLFGEPTFIKSFYPNKTAKAYSKIEDYKLDGDGQSI